MKKLITILAYIFTIFGLILSFLPLGTIALIPLLLALLILFFAFSKSKEHHKQFKFLSIITIVSIVFVLGKTYLLKDEVEKDDEFEQQKIENKIEAKQDLKELEALEDLE